MKIVDCFIFYNELDLLNYRLNILDSVVDHFVLVEATHTFTGKEKPLIYNENKQLFEKFAHKITHIIVDDMPYKYPHIDFDKKEQWSNEYHQRNCINRGIEQLDLCDEDLIMITDVDEIPNPRVLKDIFTNYDLQSHLQYQNVSMEMDFYYYNLTNMSNEKWILPKIISYNLYNCVSANICCNDIRRMHVDYQIHNAGWHLSYFGDMQFIKNKIQQFSHQEFNSDQYTCAENISKSVETGCDLFKRNNVDLMKTPLHKNPNLPYEYEKYLQNFYRKNICFFMNNFSERGTSVATYDYARYNEEILGNKSYIVCYSNKSNDFDKSIYSKFKDRFGVFEINNISEITNIINQLDIHFFYALVFGNESPLFEFNNKAIWAGCKTIKHCVFETTFEEGDFYISVSHFLNQKYNTNIPVIPHIVYLPDTDEDMRATLNISRDAIVYGRYGGKEQFNITFVHEAIREILQTDPNIYFLFMNTYKFYEHPNIIYLDKTDDPILKTKFINTCDAMIHARLGGETFGLAVGEFSSRNKPIITCNCGDIEHLRILCEKAIVYNSVDDLLSIFKDFRKLVNLENDWNMYRDYSPSKVMELFNSQIFSK